MGRAPLEKIQTNIEKKQKKTISGDSLGRGLMEKMKKPKKHRKKKNNIWGLLAGPPLSTKTSGIFLFCFFEVFWFFKSLDTLTAVVHAFVCSCCCYVCTAVCHLLSWSSSAFGQAIAAPCQLLNCLRMIGTPASSPFLCKLSVVGVTLLRCTSVTIMAMERGNADRMEVDTGAAIPEEYLGWKEQVRPLAPILHQHLDLGPTTLTTTMRVSG